MEESTDKRWGGISAHARDQLELRDYSEKPLQAGDYLIPEHPAAINIPGVEIIQRQIHPQHHRGFFGEFAREGDVPFWPKQWSTARMFRDTAKGFHIHPPHVPEGETPETWFQKLFGDDPADHSRRPYTEEQWDLMFFIQGIAELILIDERAGLPRAQLRCLIDGDDRPGRNNAAIVIPAGVAHAIRSASSTDLIMVYGTSTTFDPQNEGRIASGIERPRSQKIGKPTSDSMDTGTDDDAGIPIDDYQHREEPGQSTWDFSGYDREIVARVWKFATTVEGNDPDLWRKDEFGAWIQRLDYGNRHSEFGWEVCDTSLGRGDSGIVALRPMQWQNYIDHVAAVTQSKITAEGLRNIRKLF